MVDQAEIHRKSLSKEVSERMEAARELGSDFAGLSDKKQGWDDLIRLTSDTDIFVCWGAASVLGSAFSHVSDKKRAWDDLHRLTLDNDNYVRRGAAYALGSAFAHVPNQKQAWKDLHKLTSDTKCYVRKGAAYALGSAFAHIPNQKQAWKDLIKLTSDTHSDEVRIAANHSSGRVSILMAIEAESEDSVRNEMENALRFFENASKEAVHFNPAKFCLPFYRSFYALTFRKEKVEAEIQKYLSEAKSAVEGSESKEKLLEAVENLGNALKEAQNIRVFNDIKSDLNAYRRYCDRACELLDTTEDKAPGASRLIRRGLPIIDEKIKEILAEIESKTKSVCKQTKGTEFETIGKEIHNAGQRLLKVRDPIGLEKSADIMQKTLSDMCKKLPEDQRSFAFELLGKAKEEQYVEDKLNLYNNILNKLNSINYSNINIVNSKNVKIIVGNNNEMR